MGLKHYLAHNDLTYSTLWSLGCPYRCTYCSNSKFLEIDNVAAIKVAPFMPPLFGYRQIANFEVYSYPQLGSYALAVAALVLVVALVLARRQWRRETA